MLESMNAHVDEVTFSNMPHIKVMSTTCGSLWENTHFPTSHVFEYKYEVVLLDFVLSLSAFWLGGMEAGTQPDTAPRYVPTLHNA